MSGNTTSCSGEVGVGNGKLESGMKHDTDEFAATRRISRISESMHVVDKVHR